MQVLSKRRRRDNNSKEPKKAFSEPKFEEVYCQCPRPQLERQEPLQVKSPEREDSDEGGNPSALALACQPVSFHHLFYQHKYAD